MMKALPFLLGGGTVLFLILGLGIFILMPGYTFSAYVSWAAALAMLFYFVLCLLWKGHPIPAKVLCLCLTGCLLLGLTAAGITLGFISRSAENQPEPDCPYLIVLGAGVEGTVPSRTLRLRIDRAYAYLTENPETICIASGGQGRGEDITEAFCIYRELTQRGIAPERIWQEGLSTSTMENLTFSKELIIQKTGTAPETIAIVSNDYHVYRAGLMAQKLDMEPVAVPAHTDLPFLRITYFLREVAALWKFLLSGN